jgi:hypothetical protein
VGREDLFIIYHFQNPNHHSLFPGLTIVTMIAESMKLMISSTSVSVISLINAISKAKGSNRGEASYTTQIYICERETGRKI